MFHCSRVRLWPQRQQQRQHQQQRRTLVDDCRCKMKSILIQRHVFYDWIGYFNSRIFQWTLDFVLCVLFLIFFLRMSEWLSNTHLNALIELQYELLRDASKYECITNKSFDDYLIRQLWINGGKPMRLFDLCKWGASSRMHLSPRWKCMTARNGPPLDIPLTIV